MCGPAAGLGSRWWVELGDGIVGAVVAGDGDDVVQLLGELADAALEVDGQAGVVPGVVDSIGIDLGSPPPRQPEQRQARSARRSPFGLPSPDRTFTDAEELGDPLGRWVAQVINDGLPCRQVPGCSVEVVEPVVWVDVHGEAWLGASL